MRCNQRGCNRHAQYESGYCSARCQFDAMAERSQTDDVFQLHAETTPESLAIAIQSAADRAAAFGIDVSVVDVTGHVVHTANCPGSMQF